MTARLQAVPSTLPVGDLKSVTRQRPMALSAFLAFFSTLSTGVSCNGEALLALNVAVLQPVLPTTMPPSVQTTNSTASTILRASRISGLLVAAPCDGPLASPAAYVMPGPVQVCSPRQADSMHLEPIPEPLAATEARAGTPHSLRR